MRKWWLWLLPLVATMPLSAQVSSPGVIYVTTAPSGSCAANPPIQIVKSTGVAYTCNNGTWAAISGSGGSSLLSTKVVYTSKLSSITGGAAVVPGSSASGTTDAASILNTAISGGNVDLEVDSGYALSTSLVLSSNTTIHCIAPQYGFIMQSSANVPVLVNAHQNAPTTSSGTGGYLVSNIGDSNIKVLGCQLNANSLEAVTGSGLVGGVSHTTNPSTGLMVPATLFTAVNGITLDGNEIYDGGVYAVAMSNVENVHVDRNYTHNPTPTVNEKYTDGVHFVGPATMLWVNSNRISAGDDSIAFNADDVNRTNSGSGNLTAASLPGWKWGPITYAHADNNTFDSGDYGIRVNSATELADAIQFTNTHGTLCGNTGVLGTFTGIGQGNIGRVMIDNWQVQTSGSCNTFSQPYNIELAANFQDLQIRGLQVVNPAVTWPILYQGSGVGGMLTLRDWDVDTQTSTVSNVVQTAGGSLGQLVASGLNWYDGVGTGNFFAGSIVPASITCSNYSGPNLLLASGWSPGVKNGDCFTNTVLTTYMSTTFNEASSGAVYGTTPAVCTTCSGSWTVTAGGSTSAHWAYNNPGATNSTADASVYQVINVGQTNYTFRATVSACASSNICQFTVRSTDANNYIEIEFSSSGTDITDVIAGSGTRIGSNIPGTTFAGNYTVTLNGTAFSITTPNGSTSGTTANTGQRVGMDFYSGTGPFTITSMSVANH